MALGHFHFVEELRTLLIFVMCLETDKNIFVLCVKRLFSSKIHVMRNRFFGVHIL